MFQQASLIKAALPAAALALGGAVIGLVLGFLLFPGGRRRRSWFGEMMYAMLRGPLILWCAAGGLFLATEILTIDRRVVVGLRNTLFVLVVLSISWSIARLVGAIVSHVSRPTHGTLASATLLGNVTRLSILAIGILIILQNLGVSITPLLTALGIGGLAIGLALQDTLANFFAGIHILSSRQVRPGDYVQLATGEEGYIEDVTWRYTTIRQLSNNLTIVPNSKLATTTLTNFYLPAMETAVIVPVTIVSDSDLEKVERVTVDVARTIMQQVSGGVAAFEPYLRYSAFSKPGISFSIVMRGREIGDQHLIRHEFIKRLHERYREQEIRLQ
jgi:small-conductance mechanosensitive channel